MASMLVAGTLAGAAPQIPTFVKSALNPHAASSGSTDQKSSAIQIGWPTNAKPTIFQLRGNQYVADIQLRNIREQTQCALFDAWLQGANGKRLAATVQPNAPVKVGGLSAEVVTVSVTLPNSRIDADLLSESSAIPAIGFLRMYSAPADNEKCTQGSKTATYLDQEIRIAQKPLMGYIFVGSLAVVFFVVLITAINLHRKKIGLFHRMGGSTWTFEKSWGANVTLGGALLVTLLGLTIFPDPPRLMTKLSYSLLQVLFGALVALAPLVYNLIRCEVQVRTNSGSTIQVQGYVALFLIAGGLVLWAAIGQVATLALLAEEFVRGFSIDQYTGITLQLLTGVLFVLLVVYGFRSLYGTAKGMSTTPADAGTIGPGFRPPAAPEALPGPISEWSIL